MDQSIEKILNGPDYFKCDRYNTRMKKTVCVEKQAGPQVGFEIDYADTMCRDCAQGIEIKGEVQGLDIKQIRRERRAFAYKQVKKAQGLGRKAQGKMDSRFHGNDEDEHVRPAVITTEGKEGEGMAEKEKCIVEGCENGRVSRGLCNKHYLKWLNKLDTSIVPLPRVYGKGMKKAHLEMIKESAERVKKSSKLKAQSSKGEEIKPEVRRQKAEGGKWQLLSVPDPVSTDIVSPALPFSVEKIEEKNRADVKIFARAFMAGLKGELISAMTEQMSGQAQGSAPTGMDGE